MSADACSVILFHTSNHAFRAEKVLKERGLSCKLVPVPRHLSSECGVCLRIERELLDSVKPVLLAAHVEIAAAHDA
ncbi:MAG: putative cytosolic protein [Burkholderiaceae bacterium]|nr:putative cytosolic protein [Burkholderiaceae bacterium]